MTKNRAPVVSKTQARESYFKPRFAVSALAAAIMAPSLAYAALEEVVVTARKTEESIQSIPVAASSFTADTIKNLNVTQTADLGKITPSVYIEAPGAASGTVARVTIRGQVQFDNIMTLDPSVGWYLDDIYLARPVNTNIGLFDIDRVESLKGPQGTLYGRNTTGGTIKIVTTKAETSGGISGYVTGGVGNYEQSKIGGAINIPIIEDKLAVRLAALNDKVDEGWQEVSLYNGNPTQGALGDYIGERKNGTKDNDLYRASVTIEPTEDLRVLLAYEQAESDISMTYGNTSQNPGATVSTVFPGLANGGALATVGQLPPPLNTIFTNLLTPYFAGSHVAYIQNDKNLSHVYLNRPNQAWAKTKTASMTVEYDINDELATKLVYGWRDLDSWFDTDIDGTSVPFSQFIKPFEQNAEQESVEWQLTGTTMDGALDWVTGLYYFEESGQDLSYSGGIPNFLATLTSQGAFPSNLYNVSITDVDKNRSRSIFFQGTLHLTDALNFTGGLRYTKDSKPITSIAYPVNFSEQQIQCRFSANSGVPNVVGAPECSWSNTDNYEYVSWTAGFDYKFAADLMGYLKASSAQRAGGQNARGLGISTNAVGQTVDSTAPFNPEKATDIELGVKGTFFDYTLQVNAAYFHTFYTQIQQTDLVNHPSGLITISTNRGRGDIDGLEIETRWQVIDNLELSGSIGLLNWKFDDDTSILPGTPSKQAMLRAAYTVPLGFADLLFDVNYAWRDEVFGNCGGGRACVRDFDQETIDSLGLLGARVAMDFPNMGLNVALWGRNLTDEEYRNTGLQLYFPTNGITPANSTAGDPLTFGVEATYKF